MIIVFSPFDFEKLCLKGGLEAKLFAFHHPTDNSWPFVRWREKNFGRAEGPLYNQRTHFPVLSEKFFRSKERGLRFCSKMSFQNPTDIFSQKLGTPFQKTFLAPDPPST